MNTIWVLIIIWNVGPTGRGMSPMEINLDSVPDPSTYCDQALTRLKRNKGVALGICVDEAKKIKQAQK